MYSIVYYVYDFIVIIAIISETTKTINMKFQDNKNVSRDAVLWRHNKSKMADGRHFKDR